METFSPNLVKNPVSITISQNWVKLTSHFDFVAKFTEIV